MPAFCCQPLASSVANAGAHPGLRRRRPVDDGHGPGRHRAAGSPPRTRAIMPAHVFSIMADMPAFVDIGRAARAAPSSRTRRSPRARCSAARPAGRWGDLGVFSFFQVKAFGTRRRGRRRAHRRRRARPRGCGCCATTARTGPPLPAPPDRPQQPLRRDAGRLPAAPAARLRRPAGAAGPDRRLLHRAVRAAGRPRRARAAGRPGRPLLLRLLAAGAAAGGPARRT